MFGSVERYSFLFIVEKESEWLQSGVKRFYVIFKQQLIILRKKFFIFTFGSVLRHIGRNEIK